ncbi:MAG: DUF3160 domain-containing protein [Armatimonadetes bacterium]|nr:DUF3160 domain-containing protein [Armatimonadota bacterium]
MMRRSVLSFALILLTVSLPPYRVPAAELPFPSPTNSMSLAARYPLDEAAETMLRRNGFVVLDSITQTDLAGCYDRHRNEGLPLFVTTDAMLHLWYELHRSLLQSAERQPLYPRLCEAVATLSQTASTLRKHSPDAVSQSALLDAAVTLAVSECLLLDDARVPADLRPAVNAWVSKVRAHSEVAPYPGEDFTQYTVRGHYTDSPELSRYFRGSMWLSRRFMEVEPAAGNDADAPLRRAVALAAILRAAPTARAKLGRINAARQYLAGVPNGISLEQFLFALDRVKGKKWSLPDALRPAALASLRKELAKDEYPKSPVFTRPTVPGVPFPEKVVSLLPDFAIPDSVLFQSTMSPGVPGRSLPRGLEVAAALGSEVAQRQIQLADPQAAQVLSVVNRNRPLVRQADRSVYDGWLQTLSTLFLPDPRGFEFMRGEAWHFEKTNTCMSSWAHLRHSYILYGAQPGAPGSAAAIPRYHLALVEPIPPFFHELAGLAERTSLTLRKYGALAREKEPLLDTFIAKCHEFETCAELELQGKLTEEQADKIAGFGSWLEGFHLISQPLVADVATGMQGEILHAATGSFNPMLVMPDRVQGVAYIGWVMSYYEFVRPGFRRLTDAEWQKMNETTYLRPDRPAWAGEFACVAGGEEWVSRAPLRETERLLLSQQGDAALALLRRVVAENPDKPLATEAQCRIGKFFMDQKEYATAAVELSKCRRMYGCEASGTAKSLLGRVRWEQSRKDTEGARKEPQEIQQAREALMLLKDASLDSSKRLALEKRLAWLFLRMSPPVPDSPLQELRNRAAAACRPGDIKELLTFAALAAGNRYARYGQPVENRNGAIRECLSSAQSFRAPPLRAAAKALAVGLGLHADDPKQALATLRPFLKPDVFQPENQPVLRTLREVSGEDGVDFDLDPRRIFLSVVDGLREKLILDAYQSGQLDTMMQYFRTLPAQSGNGSINGLDQLYSAFPDFGGRPLSLFARVGVTPQTTDFSHAAERYFDVYRKYPRSKFAPFALLCSASAYRQASNLKKAKEAEARVRRQFPNTLPGLLCKARAAYEAGDVALTRQCVALYSKGDERRPDYSHRILHYPVGDISDMSRDLWRYDAVQKALEPIAKATGRSQLLQEIPFPCDLDAMAKKFSAAVPDQAAEVYLALTKAIDSPSLCRYFLERFPTHPAAAEVRWQRAQRAQLPESLKWLAPILNGNPGDKYFEEASRLFAKQLSAEGILDSVAARVKHVRGAFPNTRVALVADCILARSLAARNRPEEALQTARNLLNRPSLDDQLRVECQTIAHKAELEVWAKHQPDWTPVWAKKVGKPASGFNSYDDNSHPIATPVAAQGLLLVPYLSDSRWEGIVALKEDTGEEKWRAKIGPVCSLSADGAGRLFCGTDTSAVFALEMATGRVLYERVLDINRQWPSYAIVADKNLVVCSQAGVVAGLSPATGDILWQRDWMPVMGTPAVIGGSCFVATPEGKVRALDSATGEVLWEKSYSPKFAGRQVIHSPPVVVPPDGLLVCAGDAEYTLDLLDASNGIVRKSADKEDAGFFTRTLLPGNGFIVGGEQNGKVGTLSLPELKRRDTALPQIRDTSSAALHGRVLYSYGTEVQAVDIDTGALLAWWPLEERYQRIGVAVGKHVYVAAPAGQVTALPIVSTR